MKPVKSSTIEAVDHDGKQLSIKFKSGGTYDYPDVPQHLHDQIMVAHDNGESIGRLFHALIRNVYDHKKRDEEPKS